MLFSQRTAPSREARGARKQTPHADGIDAVLASFSGARRSGFRRAFDAIEFLHLRDEGGDPTPEDLAEGVPELTWENRKEFGIDGRRPVVPDAFFVDFRTQTIVAFEVEDTNRVTTQKDDAYGMIALDLDCIYWNLVVVGVNRWGGGALIGLPVPTPPPESAFPSGRDYGSALSHFERIEFPFYLLSRMYTEMCVPVREASVEQFLNHNQQFVADDYWLSRETQQAFVKLMGKDRK